MERGKRLLRMCGESQTDITLLSERNVLEVLCPHSLRELERQKAQSFESVGIHSGFHEDGVQDDIPASRHPGRVLAAGLRLSSSRRGEGTEGRLPPLAERHHGSPLLLRGIPVRAGDAEEEGLAVRARNSRAPLGQGRGPLRSFVAHQVRIAATSIPGRPNRLLNREQQHREKHGNFSAKEHPASTPKKTVAVGSGSPSDLPPTETSKVAPTSSKTTEALERRPLKPPAATVVSVEDILVPAISALSTLTVFLLLASAAIVVAQTWNSFCEGRHRGEEDYLYDDDRRALTRISLRCPSCKIEMEVFNQLKKISFRNSGLSRAVSPPAPLATTAFVTELDPTSDELEQERTRRQNLANNFKESLSSC